MAGEVLNSSEIILLLLFILVETVSEVGLVNSSTFFYFLSNAVKGKI